ncbi:hypothetical protein [Burkholderia ubonensis]|uniref:Uncharacterized protein n=1 Tax=Burkholderia ubonensis subsp. mesacidophila TaxID=265293 RepID=A0A2A4FKS1_9BURK|nr:hypothetical protein [Burkholderia ubonensis]PCE33282.1 hypothetical protein BZL54_06085 [Burkholderia ubonensis subsp. mesacidophila]
MKGAKERIVQGDSNAGRALPPPVHVPHAAKQARSRAPVSPSPAGCIGNVADATGQSRTDRRNMRRT